MQILFLQTGGTIDKDYPPTESTHGYSFVITTPAYERILKRVNPSFKFETITIVQKDSLDITDDDRELILQACQESSIDNIIITHGTDTMIKTAQLLNQLRSKTIVLTGALSPELFKETDADFNLGVAVGAVAVLNPGVYIAMNGRVMPWGQIVFSKKTDRFTQKD